METVLGHYSEHIQNKLVVSTLAGLMMGLTYSLGNLNSQIQGLIQIIECGMWNGNQDL
jgi:hypothetical protein